VNYLNERATTMNEEVCEDCGEYMEEFEGEWYCIQSQGCERDVFELL